MGLILEYQTKDKLSSLSPIFSQICHSLNEMCSNLSSRFFLSSAMKGVSINYVPIYFNLFLFRNYFFKKATPTDIIKILNTNTFYDLYVLMINMGSRFFIRKHQSIFFQTSTLFMVTPFSEVVNKHSQFLPDFSCTCI